LSKLPRPGSGWIDVVLAVVLAVVYAVSARNSGNWVIPLIAGVILSGTIAFRRRAPLAATVTAFAAAWVFGATHTPGHFAVTPVVLVLDLYSLGQRSARRGGMVAEGLILAAALPAIVLQPARPPAAVVATIWTLFILVPFLAGQIITNRTALAAALKAEAAEIRRAQSAREDAAVSGERMRMAQELHDVIAHNVSVIVIQAQAARLVARSDHDSAQEALRRIGRTGRDALTDLRRSMGELRYGELDDGTPGLLQLESLVDRSQAAGVRAELHLNGTLPVLPPDLDHLAFRVVQEAITNVIKHAGPGARVDVYVRVAADDLELEITDEPGPASLARRPIAAEGGHGLTGMRERLALHHGELEAGAGPSGGFRVWARIPTSEMEKT
jgi:signal transduction histidine kinase